MQISVSPLIGEETYLCPLNYIQADACDRPIGDPSPAWDPSPPSKKTCSFLRM